MFKKLCNVSNPFRPTLKSLFHLMTMYTENEIFKTLRSEKTVQVFFYECVSDFIKKEEFEYL